MVVLENGGTLLAQFSWQYEMYQAGKYFIGLELEPQKCLSQIQKQSNK
jgi:hypothetical protein